MPEEKLTFCRLCEPMCGLRVEVDGGRVTRIRGDREHPVSRGWLCRRGAAFVEVQNDPDRLRRPMRRDRKGFSPVRWDAALSEVSGKLARIRNEHGPEAVAVYMGNPMAFCTYGAMSVPAFVKALGTSRFYTSGSQDCNNKFAASRRVFGSSVLQPVPDLDRVEYLLVVGGNPAVSGMSFVQAPRPADALRRIRKRGGRVVVVDPRRTETCALADAHHFIEPETDPFFLLSLLHVIVTRDRADARWVREDPEGFAALREVAERWPPERTEPITGIPAGTVEEIAAALSGTRPAACYASIGINLGRCGTLNYWLVLALNLLAGHFDRPGGSIVCRGLVDPVLLGKLAGVDQGGRRSAVGDFAPVMGTYPAATLAREILNERKPRVRALVVVAGNPLLSVPNESRLKEALGRLDLLVCLDLYRNETGAYAHVLLPATSFLEREDLNLSHAGLQVRRHAALTPPVVAPDGEQREEWEVLQDLADAMGVRLGGRGGEAFLRAAGLLRSFRARGRDAGSSGTGAGPPRTLVSAVLKLLGQKSLAELETAPRGIPLGPHTFGRFRARSLPGRRKVRLAPPDLLREAWKLEGALAIRESERKDVRLIGKRERHTHNTWMHNADGLVRGEPTNRLYLHPDDAAARGIRDDDTVIVGGLDGGRVEVRCRLTRELKPGVVALPHGWGHRHGAGWRKARRRPGVNVNRLLTDSVWNLEPVAGMAWMNGVPVTLKRKRAPAKTRRRETGGSGKRTGRGVRSGGPATGSENSGSGKRRKQE